MFNHSQSPSVLTVDEAAKILKVSRGAAYEAVRRGDIPSIRLGRTIRVPRAALERLLEGDGAHSDAA